jgi:hypothetical protein
MQYKIVSSEITGRVNGSQVSEERDSEYPGTDKEYPALSVQYETKKADKKSGNTAPC